MLPRFRKARESLLPDPAGIRPKMAGIVSSITVRRTFASGVRVRAIDEFSPFVIEALGNRRFR
jgi:hypothetical protein